ncbi:patatin-like phospholipase family protein [Planosporangium mesophilum]|uniref:Patatin family protein n=1 Tax=Planosporangium mesophilum TaxID=689768 RepID=A0A8J3TCN4_9ACTN|nr:patatin-like phospholipase family protein [Planosporangium mesophilum]NJC82936.1 patatin family protein [Planosporangium mesophilum]GII24715.1 patatin family protein [Planosporangium mesophilum]
MTVETSAPHDVIRVLLQRAATGSVPGSRTDGCRVALAIEGGGMRGTVSGGMALALHELGLVTSFDAVYGASAGAINGAWLLSSNPDLLRRWADPTFADTLIRTGNLMRGRPIVDVETLVEVVYQTVSPLDFASVLANPVEFHPLATDVATGESTDLRPLVRDEADLRLAMRASAALPLLAGPAVQLGGRRFYDAGVSESVPFRMALAQGATHVLVLRSRRHTDTARPSRLAPLIARTALRRHTVAFREAFLGRAARLAADDELLAGYDLGAGDPAVMSIRPDAASPRVGRLARDGQVLAAALEAGGAAVHATFAAVRREA